MNIYNGGLNTVSLNLKFPVFVSKQLLVNIVNGRLQIVILIGCKKFRNQRTIFLKLGSSFADTLDKTTIRSSR